MIAGLAEPPPPAPVASTVMTPEDGTELVRIMNEKKLGDAKCELCGTAMWTAGCNLYSPQLFVPEASGLRWVADRGLMHVSMICTNCGNTKFLNASMLGFRPDVIGPGK